MKEIRELVERVKKMERELRELRSVRSSSMKKGYFVRYVKCGKKNCRVCASGEGHGPYVYKTVREGDRVRSIYMGKLGEGSLGHTPDVKELEEIENRIKELETTLEYVRSSLKKLLSEL